MWRKDMGAAREAWIKETGADEALRRASEFLFEEDAIRPQRPREESAMWI
jgi:hypothetical protein